MKITRLGIGKCDFYCNKMRVLDFKDVYKMITKLKYFSVFIVCRFLIKTSSARVNHHLSLRFVGNEIYIIRQEYSQN